MDGDEVDGAAAARLQEPAEPVEPYRPVAVADRRGSQLRLAGVRLHVLVPRLGRLLRGEIGLFRKIWFVESQQVCGASSDGCVRVGFPVADMDGERTPHHGNKVEVGRDGAPGLGIPIIAP